MAMRGVCEQFVAKGMEKIVPYGGQIIIQLAYAGLNILARLAIKDGLNHFVFVTYRLGVGTLAIAPFAYVLEREQRPPFTWCIFFQIFLLSLGNSIGQNCFFEGVYYTSATFGSAALNLVPVLVFVMAFLVRLEKIDIRSLRGQAKVVGIVLCASGAMVMTFYKGPALRISSSSAEKATNAKGFDTNTNIMLGSILIFGAVVACAGWLTFQGPVMKRYPPQLSLTTLICVFGSLQSGIIGLIAEHNKLEIWVIRPNVQLLTILYTGIICSAFGFYVQAWCIEKKGPVFAGVFTPVSTIFTAVLEFIILHINFYVGSVVGIILIFSGLYIALWGKAKDQVKFHEISTTYKDGDGDENRGPKEIKDNVIVINHSENGASRI